MRMMSRCSHLVSSLFSQEVRREDQYIPGTWFELQCVGDFTLIIFTILVDVGESEEFDSEIWNDFTMCGDFTWRVVKYEFIIEEQTNKPSTLTVCFTSL